MRADGGIELPGCGVGGAEELGTATEKEFGANGTDAYLVGAEIAVATLVLGCELEFVEGRAGCT